MSELDAKVNMSLDEIIKMEKKGKKKKATTSGNPGAKRNRGATRGRPGLRGRNRATRGLSAAAVSGKNEQNWKRNRSNSAQAKVAKKPYNRNGLVRSRSNLALNQKTNVKQNNNFNARRGRNNKFGLTRSRSRTNLTFSQGGFFTNNKKTMKKTSSLPNLNDPTSVHNRLGYQSPAQVAYRNRVKRAKQILLQRQSQKLAMQNQYRAPQMTKTLTTLQQRSLDRRQQILTSQRNFITGGLRSDQIERAQRRAQYEQKLLRLNAARLNASSNVTYMPLGPMGAIGTIGVGYTSPRQHSINLNMRSLPRGRSPFRQNIQATNMINRPSMMTRPRSRSRSRSRSRTRHVPATNDLRTDVDDRTFSKIMYSSSRDLGVTGRTLNDRFSY